MNTDTSNKPITMILFNDRTSKTFTHTRAIKRLLTTTKIKIYPKKGKISETLEILKNSLITQSITTPAIYDEQLPDFDCTHLIGIQECVKRNEFFDLTFSENIVGSFTASTNELGQLEELNERFFQSLYMHRGPLRWLNEAEKNLKRYEHYCLTDPSVTNFDFHHLKSLSETYGVQALKECQANIRKWIEDHRWAYID